MKALFPILSLITAVALHGATIDRIDLNYNFGYFSGVPGTTMILSGFPQSFTLSNGLILGSGAGGSQCAGSSLIGVSQNAEFVNYTFNPLMDSSDAQNVFLETLSFSTGSHHTQGTLTFIGEPTIVAAVGSNIATWTGKVHILSNHPTFGTPSGFDYFSQTVGSEAIFTSTITNESGNWTVDSFNETFNYHVEGYVQFDSSLTPVPEPSTYGLSAAFLLLGVMVRKRIQKSKR